MHRNTLLLALFLPIASQHSLLATTLPLGAGVGQSFVFEFELPGIPPEGTDVFTTLRGSSSGFGITGAHFALFDGNQLLGTLESPVPSLGGGGFIASGSLREGNASSAVVDFSSILDGTIDGRIVITPIFSLPQGGVSLLVEFGTGQSVSEFGLSSNSVREVTITSARVIPEPSSLEIGILLPIGLLLHRKRSYS